MQVQMRKNLVGVVTPDRGKSNSVYIVPEDTFSTGVIQHLGPDADSDLKLGMKVSFGKNLQNIRIGAKDIKVMEDANIVAILGDANEEGKKTETITKS